VLTNYHRKKASRSSCIDNAIEEAS
jgi:hypothetical protein